MDGPWTFSIPSRPAAWVKKSSASIAVPAAATVVRDTPRRNQVFSYSSYRFGSPHRGWASHLNDQGALDSIGTEDEQPPHPTCGYAGCSLDALWRQYDPTDSRYPRFICTHHRSYLLVRSPEAVHLYGWVGLFSKELSR